MHFNSEGGQNLHSINTVALLRILRLSYFSPVYPYGTVDDVI